MPLPYDKLTENILCVCVWSKTSYSRENVGRMSNKVRGILDEFAITITTNALLEHA